MTRFIKMECPDNYVNINNIGAFEVVKNCDNDKWQIYVSTGDYSHDYIYKSFDTEKEARESLKNFIDEINGKPLNYIFPDKCNKMPKLTSKQLQKMGICNAEE